ncbi:MAG: streptogrisin [Cryptosporangiaceae bacterium]|nr:streptogrisin [Cryptosporangiaceae bacterium]
MTRLTRRALSCGGIAVAVALVTMALPPLGAHAGSTGADAARTGPDRQAIAALAGQTGLSPAAAAARLSAQSAQTALGERVTARLGAKASGFWLRSPDGAAVVDVTDAAAVPVVKAAGANARLVSRSAAALAATQRRLERLLTPGTSVGTDVVANQVVVTVTAAARHTDALVTAARRSGDAVRIDHTGGSLVPAISGGHPIDYLNQDIGCSLAFNVTGGYALTAGHCTAINAQWENGNNNRYFGPSVRTNFPGDDFGLIRNDGRLTQSGDVYLYPGGLSQDITGAASNYVGQFVCKSGRTTGTTCALIDKINVTVDYAQGSVYGLVQSGLCVRPGDSGGAVFQGGDAKGIVSGVQLGTCTSFYQPVLEALQVYGVSVF